MMVHCCAVIVRVCNQACRGATLDGWVEETGELLLMVYLCCLLLRLLLGDSAIKLA